MGASEQGVGSEGERWEGGMLRRLGRLRRVGFDGRGRTTRVKWKRRRGGRGGGDRQGCDWGGRGERGRMWQGGEKSRRWVGGGEVEGQE